LPWGKYVADSKCIIIHTPKSVEDGGKSPFAGIKGYYIQLAVLNYATPVYRWISDDTELTIDEIAEMKTFITPKKDSGKQGLEKPYIIVSPRFETIDSISHKKVNYQLID